MTSSEEHGRSVVEAYAKGIICSGEVFNQYLDRISPETVEMYMALLSPELIQRFGVTLQGLFQVDHPLAKAEDIERWQRADFGLAAR